MSLRILRIAGFLLLLVTLGFSACTTVPKLPPNTPLTVEGYKKALEDRLGPIWTRELTENASAAEIGTVKVTFQVPAAGGRVTNLKVVSNTAGKADEWIAVYAVGRLRAPPTPEEILRSVHKDHLDFDESFTVFQNPVPSPTPAKR